MPHSAALAAQAAPHRAEVVDWLTRVNGADDAVKNAESPTEFWRAIARGDRLEAGRSRASEHALTHGLVERVEAVGPDSGDGGANIGTALRLTPAGLRFLLAGDQRQVA